MLGRGGIALATAALAAVLAAAPAASASGVSGDFDGDGRDDLAVGVLGHDAGGETLAGAVHVIYGGPGGLTTRDRIFTRATPGVKGAPGDDGLGAALAVGRFDGDRFDDLAVAAPFDDVAFGGKTVMNAGSVNVLYGGPSGLTPRGDQLFHHGLEGFAGAPQSFSGFGWSLAAGNLNRDRRHELVASTAFGDVGGVDRVGFVDILRGTREGLTTRRARRISQATPGVADTPQTLDRFGVSLAIGEVGRSPGRDLAIGVPGEEVAATEGAGAVHVLYGGRRRLRTDGGQFLTQSSLHAGNPNADPQSEAGDSFGQSVAFARFDTRLGEDLAIGAPGEDNNQFNPAHADAGMISVGHGGPGGIRTADDDARWLLLSEPGAQLGGVLVGADMGMNAFEDVAVSAPGAEGTMPNAGEVLVIYGGQTFTAFGSVAQGENGFEDAGESGDLFGRALSAGRFDGTGTSDLAVGVPGEDLVIDGTPRRARRGSPTPSRDVGAVHVVPTTAAGPSAATDFVLHRDSPGIEGFLAPDDFFGSALGGRDGAPTYD